MGSQVDNIDLLDGFILLEKTKTRERRKVPISLALRKRVIRFPSLVKKDG